MKKSFNYLMVFAIAASMLASCSKKDESNSSAQVEKEDLPLVEVETANNETVDQTSEYTATVEAYKTNNIMSNNGCRIKRMLVDVGSHVSAGQRVVILDDVNVATECGPTPSRLRFTSARYPKQQPLIENNERKHCAHQPYQRCGDRAQLSSWRPSIRTANSCDRAAKPS